jgi:curved DNA-binding protein CbpA
MDTSKDYYATLGVLPTAEDFVIQAAYRALSKVYHPDRYKGDDADQKMAEINEAYEVLGNKSKRAEYDRQREQSKSDDSEFFNDNFNAGSKSYDPFYDDWKVAIEYYPELDNIANELALISSRLSFSFRIYILQEKKYSEAEKVAALMKQNFLTQFFGSNKSVHEYALYLISLKRKDVLLELSRAIKVMGSGESNKIIERLSKRYNIITPTDDEEELKNKFLKVVRSVIPGVSDLSSCYRESDFKSWVQGEISDEELIDMIKSRDKIENIFIISLLVGVMVFLAYLGTI